MSDKTWVIDSHLHLFQKASEDYPRDCASFYPAEREALVDDFIEVMAVNNVRHAVIVPLGTETKYLTEILKAFPEKFSGIAVLDYQSQNPREDIRRWKYENGVKGIRIMGDIGDPSTTRFEDLALAHGIS
jgi:predicted TIM-barrel fold metal-dependent hydrolase